MEMHSARFNLSLKSPNAKLLHHKPRGPLSKEPLPLEETELVQAFEVSIPSTGRYKCPEGRPHYSPGDCEGMCIPPEWSEMICVDEEPNVLKYEEFLSSIVTVVKCVEYCPEACMKGDVEEVPGGADSK
jgi:hypothetical protein